jgi:hypothetical protein
MVFTMLAQAAQLLRLELLAQLVVAAGVLIRQVTLVLMGVLEAEAVFQ